MTRASTESHHPESQRLTYLDHLRVCLVALVICHHAAVAHGAVGRWYYVVSPPDDSLAPLLLTFFVVINQAFFMSLFFLISAFFTPPSYDRKGAVPFLKDRLKRLGLPLLVYFFLLNPSLEYLNYRFTGQTQQAYLEFMRHSLIQEVGLGPLWFVFTLLVFTTFYVAIRVIAERSERELRARHLPSNLQISTFVVGAGLVTFLAR